MSRTLEEKLEYYQLVGKNADQLKKAGALLLPELDRALEHFYERATSNPQTAAFFDGPERMAHARAAQKRHWERMLTAQFDAEYAASVERIGRVHARINLPLDTYMSSYSLATSELLMIYLQKVRIGFSGKNLPQVREQLAILTRAFALDVERVVETTFRVIAEEQTRAFDYINKSIEKLSDGDLTHTIPGPDNSDFPRAFDDVRVKLNGATTAMNATLDSIAQAMNRLGGVIETVDNDAGSLSNRTASQAASLEETAAAIHELTENAAQTSQNIFRTKEVADAAARTADQGSEAVGEAAEAMGRIQTSSERINRFIGMIEDIAFQTNLLALNAGVEAARAGPAGRGFAVVAEEVRQLAGNASDAARQIKELVTASNAEVTAGVDLIHHAASTLGNIVKNFDEVAHLTNEISVASQEQSTALSEINSAITQMDMVTQQNAAMVDATTSATAQMKSEAMGVNGLLARLLISPVAVSPPEDAQMDIEDPRQDVA